MRWPGTGHCTVKDHLVCYAGNNDPNHWNGVGIILHKKFENNIIGCIQQYDRILLLKIRGQHTNINLIQLYVPTADKSEDQVEEFYAQLNNIMKNTKKHETTIIMGHFNAKVGTGSEDDLVGQFRLGARNERGNRLVQSAEKKSLLLLLPFIKYHQDACILGNLQQITMTISSETR